MTLCFPNRRYSDLCSSLAAQLHFLDSMRPERLPDFVLVVQAENSTRAIDYNDRNSCVLWGDCTSAQVISPRLPARLKVTHSQFASNRSEEHTSELKSLMRT